MALQQRSKTPSKRIGLRALLIVAAVVTVLAGYFVGRSTDGGTEERSMRRRLELTRQRVALCEAERRLLRGAAGGGLNELDELAMAQQDKTALITENALLEEDNHRLRQETAQLRDQAHEFKEEIDALGSKRHRVPTNALLNGSLSGSSFTEAQKAEAAVQLMSEIRWNTFALRRCRAKVNSAERGESGAMKATVSIQIRGKRSHEGNSTNTNKQQPGTSPETKSKDPVKPVTVATTSLGAIPMPRVYISDGNVLTEVKPRASRSDNNKKK
eukprot:TRINITY_DN5348_c0_g1_i1.p1 TRINITY_DN5348_c0_g1~~TRINITY_DN5348_c0_g1_i1.p1  ORF type:complete len:279 (+),score=54.42 TRINITY_DN5348_c0_g1_i1:27-839(+)